MDVSSRQIVALAAPALVTYLTWSAVSAPSSPPPQPDTLSAIAPAAASKRPVIAELTRDAFSQDGYGVTGAGMVGGAGPRGSSNAVHLNGTVVAGKWRMAIIDGARVFEGQSFRGFQVRTVARDSVTLVNGEGKPVVLTLDIAEPPPLATLARTKPVAPAKSGGTEVAEKREASARENEPRPSSQPASRTESSAIARSAQDKPGGLR